MVTAIVLIKAEVARIPETAEAIVQIPEVSEVYSVTGEFDLVAMVRVRSHDELGDIIPGRVENVAAQGYRRIGILGTSLGSCIAFIAAAHDRQHRRVGAAERG